MKIYELCHAIEDKKNGKKRWKKHGILIVKDDGKMSLKLESMPTTDFGGWFGVFPRKDSSDSADGAKDNKTTDDYVEPF